MSTIFRVVDLTQPHPESETKSPLQAGAPGTVDLGRLRGQLQEIRDALTPVVADQEGKGFHLDTIELWLRQLGKNRDAQNLIRKLFRIA